MAFVLNESDLVGRVTIDLINDINYCFSKVPEGSGSGRYILISLTKNGVPYNFNSSLFIAIGGKNAAGTNIYDNCIVYSEHGINKVLVPLANQISAAPGVGHYRIELIDKSITTAIESFNFNILVTTAPYDIGGVIASNEYLALINAISNSNGWTVGSGVPTNSMGSTNDYYLDADTGEIYHKEMLSTVATWVDTGLNIKENIYVRYSPTDDITLSDMTNVADNSTRFIGFYISTDATASTNKADYVPWQRIRNEIVSSTYTYQVSTNGTSHPTSGTWRTTIPSNINDGEYLWIKTVNKYEDGSTSAPSYSVSRNGATGTPGGFDTPTYDNTDANQVGNAECIVTASGPDTAKVFDFKFNNLKGVRGSQWFSGTAISSAGTSTLFNSSNAFVNDKYINTNSGNMYECTAVTPTNSTWVYITSISAASIGTMMQADYATLRPNVVDAAVELDGVTFIEGTLSAGGTLLTLNNAAFVDSSSVGSDVYMYRIFTSDPEVRPISQNLSNGKLELTFGRQATDLYVAVEVRKR